jgi:hypothetical protein
MSRATSAYQLHRGVKGGPDIAIMYAMNQFLKSNHSLMVLLENDVLLHDGWLNALINSMLAAEKDGFKVGGSSARVIQYRVLAENSGYNLLWNSGAGCIALTQEGAKKVLQNYRTIQTSELIPFFENISGRNFEKQIPELLSADWSFDYVIYSSGLVVTSPAINYAHNIDMSDIYFSPGNLPALSSVDFSKHSGDVRFPKSLVSGKVFLPVHSLRYATSECNLRISGSWERKWSPTQGPFHFFGDGLIEFRHSSRIGLFMHFSESNAVIEANSSYVKNNNIQSVTNQGYLEYFFDVAAEGELTTSQIIIRDRKVAFLGLMPQQQDFHMYLNSLPPDEFYFS